MGKGLALVTGAAGFIGSHLVERLVADGWDVRALARYTSRPDAGYLDALPAATRGAVEIVRGNVEDPTATAAAVKGAGVVFHLAALIGIPYSYAAPQQYVATNVVGTLNVLEAARAAGGDTRVVCVSTSEVYGTARYTPIDEEHPLQAQSPYSATKIGAEKLAQSYALSFALPVTVVRPFNTYGPRQSARAVIPTIVSQCLRGREIRLGSLDPVRDFNFVGDTVRGLIAAGTAATTPGDVFNVGSGHAVTVGEVVRLVQELCGTSLPVVTDDARVRPARSEVMELRCDNRRAKERLGWEPHATLAEGLRETIDWVRGHADLFRPGEYAV
jgi:UDP-glucose 4-epimerase